MGPLSLYPLVVSALIALPTGRFGPICCHFDPYRSALWPFRRLSLYPLVDLGRFVPISVLIALPFGHFGAYRSTLWSAWADLLPFRPLSLYPLAMSALSYVPFISVPCWAPCCRTLTTFSSLATYPLGLGGVSSRLPPRGLGFCMVFLGDKGFTFSTSRRVQVRKPGSMRGPSKASPLGFPEHPGHPQGAPWSLRSLGAPRGPEGGPGGALGYPGARGAARRRTRKARTYHYSERSWAARAKQGWWAGGARRSRLWIKNPEAGAHARIRRKR